MRNLKGANKNFSRYLDSEYHDYDLKPLPNPRISDLDCFLAKNQKQEVFWTWSEHNKYKYPKPNQLRDKKIEPYYHKTHNYLTSLEILDLVEKLGADAKNCFHGLYEFKEQKDISKLGELFEKFYENLETVPIIFLSMIYSRENTKEIEVVYLWQINRLCPNKGWGQHIVFDCRQNEEKVARSSSLLLLSKIVPKEGEKIIEVKIIGETKLLVKSITRDLIITLRIYSITNFYWTMRVNPYYHQVIANDFFSYKFIIKLSKDANNFAWDMSLWKRMCIEELKWEVQEKEADIENEKKYKSNTLDSNILISSKVCPISSSLTKIDISLQQAFSLISIEHFEDWQIFKDEVTCTFLVLGYDKFEVFSFPEVGSIHSSRYLKNHLYLLSTQGQIFSLDLSHLPTLIINKLSVPSFGDLSEKYFQWQVIEIYEPNGSVKVEHAFYSLENKLYSIPLFAESMVANLFLDFELNGGQSQEINWNIFWIGEDDNCDIPILVYVVEGSLIFYHMKIKRYKCLNKIFTQYSKVQRRWDILPAGNGILFLYDPFFENLAIKIYHGTDVNTLFSEGFDVNYNFITEGIKTKHSNSNPFRIQIGGSEKKIVLLTGGREPYYEDEINYIYRETYAVCVPNLQEKEQEISKGDNVIINKEAEEQRKKEAEKGILQRMWKTKKEVSHLDNKEKIVQRSTEALQEIRGAISEKMGEIRKYEIDLAKSVYTKEPEDVSGKYLDLYDQIKQKKIKTKRRFNKEKGKKKNSQRKLNANIEVF